MLSSWFPEFFDATDQTNIKHGFQKLSFEKSLPPDEKRLLIFIMKSIPTFAFRKD